MNSLRGKLDLLRRTSGLGASASAAPPRAASPDRGDRALLDVLGGNFVQTSQGLLHVTTHRYPWPSQHGQACLFHGRGLATGCLSPLYEGLTDFSVEKALFFDTETTGLAGGSGTYAFLVGLGYYEGEEFVTEQLLMRDHGDESALLEFFAQRLSQRSGLISFNGKTFDAGLLTTRYAMHRRSDPFSGLPHFDLLHICRRLWKESRLPDCRLETLEHRVLGAPRVDDVPGWMIPEVFFSYLRDRNPRPLQGVLEHNRRDIVAMAGLCGTLSRLLSANCLESAPADPHLRLGLARLWSALGQTEISDLFFRSALSHGELSEQARETAMTRWARCLKKRDQQEQAALLWRRVLAHSPGHLEATVELAKWFEHHRKDYRTALLLVEGSLRDRTLTAGRRRELEHRAHRLRSRMQRRSAV